jgi:hypothetical protein
MEVNLYIAEKESNFDIVNTGMTHKKFVLNLITSYLFLLLRCGIRQQNC